MEGEFLNGLLYVAHFASEGVVVINPQTSQIESVIPLPFEPTNIATDGTTLFVVGVTQDQVTSIDPANNNLTTALGTSLQQPIGIAASATHVVVADRQLGLVVIER